MTQESPKKGFRVSLVRGQSTVQNPYKIDPFFCRMLSRIYHRLSTRRAGLVMLIALILISISTVTRILLLIKSAAAMDFTPTNLLGIFFLGWFYDLANAAYFSIPLVLYLWLVPNRIFQKPWHTSVLYGLFFIFTTTLVFNGVAEWFFWDEFNTRFNFIAVDYLIYSTEVVGNIQQSYPIGWIIVGIALISALIVYGVKPWIKSAQLHPHVFRQRTKLVTIYTLIPLATFFLVSARLHHFSSNAYANELSGNGMYELFSAYRNNELDYNQFYKRIEDKEAQVRIRELIKTPEAQFLGNDGIERTISNPAPEKKLNVVLISVESLSAEFMTRFGNTDHITPHLDSLADRSLLFTNLFATGTRTVRGLEALSLCVPPLPGQSIVRRPENEDLFSLAKVFNEKGYASKFIYGGYGYFDNMNYFFGHNGYDVVDRSSLEDNEIDYENIWGVADENLFTLALREIDHSVTTKPVFAHIMTTSNHRPYTYPEGRIDIPSHKSRQGAVKYTDYAIAKFIREASQKSWFANTVFVIIADHCASSAGKSDLPVNKYHIPMIVYSPSNIQPGNMDRLMSQIDVGPTLLGLLNFSYTSKFLGYDMYKLEPGRERAFISTYQNLGYLHNNTLTILMPQSKAETFQLDEKNEPVKHLAQENLTRDAIAWYQGTNFFFHEDQKKQREFATFLDK